MATNAANRFNGITQPWLGLWFELRARYLEELGLGRTDHGAAHLKLILFAAYFLAPVLVALTPGLHKRRGVCALLLLALSNFLIFGVFIYFVTTWGNRFEETDDPKAWAALRTISGPGVISWALLMTFAATDWVMSVEPTWASSMFPVVFGMNQWMTVFAFSMSDEEKKPQADKQFAELMAVVGMANESNRLATGYQVEIDERFRA